MNAEARIRKILVGIARKPVELGREESLFKSGVLDSFALTDMISEIETEFAIAIPDSDLSLQKFDSIARIEHYIDSRLSG